MTRRAITTGSPPAPPAGRGLRKAAASLCASPARACLAVFLVALVVRVALLASWMVPTAWVLPHGGGGEIGRVARNLAATGEYANPYVVPSGPTAHPLPVYTGLVALIYRLLGLTLTAGYVRSVLGIVLYSAMYATLPWFTARVGLGRAGGLVGGLAGALVPQQSAGEVIGWGADEPLAAMALAVLLVGFLRYWGGGAPAGRALLLGAGFGAAFHVAPALLGVLLGCLVLDLGWRREPGRWRAALLVALGTGFACLPWAWRNYATFGEIFFVRSNFGLELRVANHPGAAAAMEVLDAREGSSMRHPGNNAAEARRVRALGEMAYMREARQEALTWIRAHPEEFLRLTASRVAHYWCGPLHRPGTAAGTTLLTLLALLGAVRLFPGLTVPQRAAVLIPLLAYPPVYYVVTYMSRYAVPMNWLLLGLAGAALCRRRARVAHADGP